MENGTRTEVKKHLEAAIPAVIVGLFFAIGSVGTIAIYGTPWETKEKADMNTALIQQETTNLADKLKDVAQLNKDTAAALSEVRSELGVQKEKQAEEDRRLEMLESWHRK